MASQSTILMYDRYKTCHECTLRAGVGDRHGVTKYDSHVRQVHDVSRVYATSGCRRSSWRHKVRFSCTTGTRRVTSVRYERV